MTLDKDGKIRMDCSSPYAMQGLIQHKERFDIAFGNDPEWIVMGSSPAPDCSIPIITSPWLSGIFSKSAGLEPNSRCGQNAGLQLP